MAWTEADRVALRKYCGASSLFLQAQPRFETAVTAIQSVADGGTRPTNDAENAIRAILARLVVYEQTIDDLLTTPDVMKAEEVGLDPARGLVTIRMQARSLCSQIAYMLGMDGVLADAFAAGPVIPNVNEAFDRKRGWS